MKKKTKLLVIFFFVLLLDQFTKYIIRTNLMVRESIPIIDKIFSITYLRNTGVSFGLFKGFNILFIFITLIVLGFFVYVYLKKRKYPVQFALIFAGIMSQIMEPVKIPLNN